MTVMITRTILPSGNPHGLTILLGISGAKRRTIQVGCLAGIGDLQSVATARDASRGQG